MKKNMLFGFVPFIAGVLLFVMSFILNPLTSSIDANGILHEPFFFLLPIAFVLVIAGVIVSLTLFFRNKLKKS